MAVSIVPSSSLRARIRERSDVYKPIKRVVYRWSRWDDGPCSELVQIWIRADCDFLLPVKAGKNVPRTSRLEAFVVVRLSFLFSLKKKKNSSLLRSLKSLLQWNFLFTWTEIYKRFARIRGLFFFYIRVIIRVIIRVSHITCKRKLVEILILICDRFKIAANVDITQGIVFDSFRLWE